MGITGTAPAHEGAGFGLEAVTLPAAGPLGISDGQGWMQFGELGAAFGLSALIGLERELRQKSAGLRTHTLVGVAAALALTADSAGADRGSSRSSQRFTEASPGAPPWLTERAESGVSPRANAVRSGFHNHQARACRMAGFRISPVHHFRLRLREFVSGF